MTSTALPGQYLGPATEYTPGPGVHLHNGNLHASLLGRVSTTSPSAAAAGPSKRPTRIPLPSELPLLSVLPPAAGGRNGAGVPGMDGRGGGEGGRAGRQGDGEGGRREVLPQVGDVVLCRVMRITPRQAAVAILVVGGTVLEGEWAGVIRVQDVRATEKERVRVHESFRPGDVVRAQVISLGDQANYYLATTSNELGVIMATSEAGNAMYPVSWKEYKDPETGLSEARKVAKPF